MMAKKGNGSRKSTSSIADTIPDTVVTEKNRAAKRQQFWQKKLRKNIYSTSKTNDSAISKLTN
jgi:hypothetical protein